MDIIHCRFELAKKYQNDVSLEKSDLRWKDWQEAFGDDVFRININKILDENVEHMLQLTEFLKADWHPNWRQLVRDYRKHINV